MSRLFDRLGLFSLIIACLAFLAGGRAMLALGIVAAALASPGLRRKPTISTVSNRSMSVAGLVLGVLAIGLSTLFLTLGVILPRT
ncbi:hypothetical protein [Nonomuraea sp. JJY05]|jgi:hypothetical protein|uniref:hypothetical protein n=1 Tax=Nonomuraea sp. JJY05 TaxID=3350255 RepID=UPI00373F5254